MPVIVLSIIGACLSLPFIVLAGETTTGRTIIPRPAFYRRISEKHSLRVPATPSPTASSAGERTESPTSDPEEAVFEPRPSRPGMSSRRATIEEVEAQEDEEVDVRWLDRQRRVRTGWSVATMDSYIRNVGGLEKTGLD